MNAPDLSQLQIFFGRLTETSAAIYAKLPTGHWSDGFQLAGEVVGPVCDGSRTLPAGVPMRFSGADPTPLASASVPDPSFWSPALPARYEVTVRVTDGETTVTERKRRIALRRFGPQRRSFVDQGRRLVIRGAADHNQIDQHAAEDWRELRLHYIQSLNEQTDIIELAQQLDGAERTGFPLVMSVATMDESALRTQLTLCSNCAAVTLSVIERSVSVAERSAMQLNEVSQGLPNLRLAAEVSTLNDDRPSWAMALVVRTDELTASQLKPNELDVPIILRRSNATLPKDLASKRKLCEQLQREFTSAGDFAGYLLG